MITTPETLATAAADLQRVATQIEKVCDKYGDLHSKVHNAMLEAADIITPEWLSMTGYRMTFAGDSYYDRPEGVEAVSVGEMQVGQVYVQRVQDNHSAYLTLVWVYEVRRKKAVRVFYQTVELMHIAGSQSFDGYTGNTYGRWDTDYYPLGMSFDEFSAALRKQCQSPTFTRWINQMRALQDKKDALYDEQWALQEDLDKREEQYVEPLVQVLGRSPYRLCDGRMEKQYFARKTKDINVLYRIVAKAAMGLVDAQVARDALEVLLEVSTDELPEDKVAAARRVVIGDR